MAEVAHPADRVDPGNKLLFRNGAEIGLGGTYLSYFCVDIEAGLIGDVVDDGLFLLEAQLSELFSIKRL